MKKAPACKGCPNCKMGKSCFYILADSVELCPKVKEDYEKFAQEKEVTK